MRPDGKPTLIDLFCGAGGFSLGFAAAGCHVVAGVDFDEASGRTYEENFGRLQEAEPPMVFYGDEGNLEELDFPDISEESPDILIGGPPCQGFSRIGRAKLESLLEEGSEESYADDPRNELYRRFLAAAKFWQPKAVVMENVPGMQSVNGVDLFQQVADEVGQQGYTVGYAVLNASWYGVPQFRERFFLIGIKKDLGIEPRMPSASHRSELPAGYIRPVAPQTRSFSFMESFKLPVDLASARWEATSVYQALGDLPQITDHLAGGKRHPPDRLHEAVACPIVPPCSYARLMRRWPGFAPTDAVTEHVIRRTPRDYETFRRMRPDDRYPEALEIARARLREKLAELAALGTAPEKGTPEWAELERSFVPPYPEGMFVDKWRKLHPERPSWTVPAHLAKDAYSHIHYDDSQARAISIREAARIQSFPDAFRFVGNMGDCYRQIGNAVPPLMAWAIAHKVLGLLGYESKAPVF